MGTPGSYHPFGNRLPACQYFLQRDPSSHLDTNAAIAAETARARENEIAQACKARERCRIGTKLHAKTRHLGQSACYERCARIEAETKAISDAGRHSHHVLERPTYLHSDYVGPSVGAEMDRAECSLSEKCRLRICRGYNYSSRLLRDNLGREARAGKRNYDRLRYLLRYHVGHQTKSVALYSFCRDDVGSMRRKQIFRGFRD